MNKTVFSRLIQNPNRMNFHKNAQTADLPTLEKGMTLQSTSNSMKNRLDHMRAHGKTFLPKERRCQNCYFADFFWARNSYPKYWKNIKKFSIHIINRLYKIFASNLKQFHHNAIITSTLRDHGVTTTSSLRHHNVIITLSLTVNQQN